MTDTPDAERLKQIDERIDKARSQAEDAGILVDEPVGENAEEFADSGATPAADDQTIAPPG
jgi:phage shock protein A